MSESATFPSSFRLRNKEKLLAIEEALEMIREGTYGMCEECGEEIGGGRLKAMPLAGCA